MQYINTVKCHRTCILKNKQKVGIQNKKYIYLKEMLVEYNYNISYTSIAMNTLIFYKCNKNLIRLHLVRYKIYSFLLPIH